MYNALPLETLIQNIRAWSAKAKILFSGQYIYNKWATSGMEEYEKMKRVVGADFYITTQPPEQAIYAIIKEENLNNSIAPKNKLSFDFNSVIYYRTSFGCPAKCSFCNYPIKNKELRYKDLDIVKYELQEINKHDVNTIIFMDETFNLPKSRFKSICRMIIKNRFKFNWYCYCRLKELDIETVTLMAASNCRGVFVGIESTDEIVLGNMNKGATLVDLERGLVLLSKYDITVFAFFLIGFPGETAKTVENNIRFLNNSNIDFYTANLWYADVSTPVFDNGHLYCLKGRDFNWQHTSMNSIEATKLTDIMVCKVKKSVWVPNEQFGFQGVVYLMNKGYTLEQVKEILQLTSKLVEMNITNSWNQHKITIEKVRDLLKKC